MLRSILSYSVLVLIPAVSLAMLNLIDPKAADTLIEQMKAL